MGGTELENYVDDNTPYVMGNDTEDIIFKFQNASKVIFQWFTNK